MTGPRAVWPDIPPEVPPPWRPDEPRVPAGPGPPPVPLVPHRAPDRSDDWGLMQRRTVLLFGPVDEEVATRVAAQIMALDADNAQEIRLQLSCRGGDLTWALMLADTVHLARSPVAAVAQGVVSGVALAPFCAASRRLAAPSALLQLGEPRLSLSGDPDELTAGAQALLAQVGQLKTWLVGATGQPQQVIADDMRRGRILTPAEAIGYGLVDEMAAPTPPASGGARS